MLREKETTTAPENLHAIDIREPAADPTIPQAEEQSPAEAQTAPDALPADTKPLKEQPLPQAEETEQSLAEAEAQTEEAEAQAQAEAETATLSRPLPLPQADSAKRYLGSDEFIRSEVGRIVLADNDDESVDAVTKLLSQKREGEPDITQSKAGGLILSGKIFAAEKGTSCLCRPKPLLAMPYGSS